MRQIPIARLLYAFGISLVRALSSNSPLELNQLQSAKSCGRSSPRPNCTSSRSSSSKCKHRTRRPAPGDSNFCAPISLQKRQKISYYNSIDDAVDLIQKSRNILILTGAGISKSISATRAFSPKFKTRQGVSCGIPDFRSENGLYASLKEKNEYDLDDPQQMWVPLLVVCSFPHRAVGSTFSTSGRSRMVSASTIPIRALHLTANYTSPVF